MINFMVLGLTKEQFYKEAEAALGTTPKLVEADPDRHLQTDTQLKASLRSAPTHEQTRTTF